MHLALIGISLVVLFLILTQLGAKIPASATLLWVGVSVFIVFAAAFPESLAPLAHLLGIQLVSNLFLSTLVIFLFLVTFTQTLLLTSLQRSLRRLTTHMAASKSCVSPARDEVPSALIVVPCYNEEGAIAETVRKLEILKQQKDASFFLNYLIVNDCSTDRTPAILREVAPNHFISHGTNVGVAGVLWSGFQVAAAQGYEYVIQCDADGQHPVAAIPALLKTAIESKSDLMIGSRYLSKKNVERSTYLASTTLSRYYGSQLIRSILRFFGPSAHVQDPTSGFRVYSEQAWSYLMTRIPDEYPEPETVAILAAARFSINEFPVEMMSRAAGTSSLAGIASLRFMIKVAGALCGLRLRMWLAPTKAAQNRHIHD